MILSEQETFPQKEGLLCFVLMLRSGNQEDLMSVGKAVFQNISKATRLALKTRDFRSLGNDLRFRARVVDLPSNAVRTVHVSIKLQEINPDLLHDLYTVEAGYLSRSHEWVWYRREEDIRMSEIDDVLFRWSLGF